MPVNSMDNDNKKMDVHVPQELIVLWDKLDEPWGVKDSQSCFVYANKGLHDLFNLPEGYDIEGRYDVELPTPVAEFHKELTAQDRAVERDLARKASLEVHRMGRENKLDAYIIEKIPYFNKEGTVVGTIFHGSKVISIPLIDGPASFMLTCPSNFFAETEWEIMFLLQKRMSHKLIAKTLGYSLNRVNKSIEVIYQKCGIGSVVQLVEFLRNMHWDSYIPGKFVRHGHTPLIV